MLTTPMQNINKDKETMQLVGHVKKNERKEKVTPPAPT